MRTGISLLILLLLLVPACLVAKEVPRTINFSQPPAQSPDKNWMIAQGPDLLIYFASNNGMLIYDGAHWRTYSLPNKQIVRSVAVDSLGRIYTGAYGEFGFWERDSWGMLQYYSLSKGLDFPLAGKEEIWNILIQSGKVIFQSFSTIYQYDYHDVQIGRSPEGTTIMFIHHVGGRNLVQAKQIGIMELKDDLSMELLPGTEILADAQVVSILPSGEDAILIGTSHQGLFIYSQTKISVWNLSLSETLKDFQLNKMIRLSGGDYALGTILNGLYLVSPEGQIRWNINREQGLQNNTILAMMEDDQQNLWLGLDQGADLVELNSPLAFFNDFNGRMGTFYAASLHEDICYVGTNHGVFIRPWKSRSTKDDFQLLPGSQGQVWELNVFDGELLCGHNKGTFRIRNGKWEQISPVTGGWTTKRLPLHPDKLIQGSYTGLLILDKDAEGWKFSHRVEGFSEPIQEMEFDREGGVWVVNPYKGLYRIMLSADLRRAEQIRAFTSEDGLPSEFDLTIESIEGEIIIQSEGRFFRYDLSDHMLREINAISGHTLASGEYRLISGMDGDFFRVFPNQVEIQRENKREKLYLPLVSGFEKIIPLNQSEYLMCMNSGYALYQTNDSAHIQKYKNPGPVISELCYWQEGEPGSCVYPIGEKVEKLRLKAQQNHLRFQYAVPSYTRRPRFRYQLIGFQQNISGWEEKSEKEFTNLSPGEYRFRVESDLSDVSAEIAFIILPAWYQTILARIIFAMLFFLLVLLLIRFQANRLEAKRKREADARQMELERQLMEARNEKLQVEILGKSKELANSTMNLIRKNEALLQLKDEFKKIRAELDQGLPYKYYKRVLRLLEGNMTNEQDWQVFETNFNQVHDQFFKRLKTDYPELTPGDLQLAAFLRMNLSSKEIAPLLNISVRGVENKRYRLRKKMALKQEENLTSILINY